MTAITALTDRSKLPNQSQDQATFDANWAYVLDTLVMRADQENALASNLSVFAAGGAFTIPFTVDTSSTAAGDPGPGKIRFNSGNQNAATALYLDLAAFGGADVTAKLDQFGASTSTVKGTLRLTQLDDLSRELVFNVTALASPAGYRTLTVVPVSGSAASPFANGATVLLHFDRTGDRGSDAQGAYQLLGSATVSSQVAQIDFLNIFTSAYDKYVLELQGIAIPASGARLYMRLAKLGAVDTAAVYAGTTTLFTISPGDMNTIPASFTIEIRNANSVSRKGVGIRGLYQNTGGSNDPISIETSYDGANAVSGFRLYPSPGNFSAGTVRVYGVRNA